MTSTHAIIPVRDFANTKLRLQLKLSEKQRFALTSGMLENVLRALEESTVDDVLIVATDPCELKEKQKCFSKLRVIQEGKRRGGVNNAMEDGIHWALERTRKEQEACLLLLLPSDLPFLNSPTVDKVIDLKKNFDLLINPSRKRDGTSLLIMEGSKMIPLHYDNDSFVNHVDESARRKMNHLITEIDAFSFDVDDEDDFALLLSRLAASTFDQLIEKLDHIAR